MSTLRLLPVPIPAWHHRDGAWHETRVKAWRRLNGAWWAWVETPDGVRLAHEDHVKPREPGDPSCASP